jgi:CO/xanthine dehydrogenase Mo-binding subunit
VDGPLPAAANALRDACGVSFSEFPLTPERVLRGLAQGAGPQGMGR